MQINPSRFTLTIPIKGDRTLAYNSGSQCFAIWDEDDVAFWNKIENGEVSTQTPGWQDFVSNKFATVGEFDEMKALRDEYELSRQRSTSLQITVCTSLYCNFGCSYCFQGMEKPTQKMPARVRDAIADYAERALQPGGHLSICWYGGEPLMGQDALFDLADRFRKIAKQKRASYGSFMISNGYLLDVEMAKRLIEIDMNHVQITVDGPKHLHDERRPLLSGRGSYDRILKNIEEFTEATDMKVSIRVNTDLDNQSEVLDMLDDFAARGLTQERGVTVYFAPVEATTVDCSGCEQTTLQKEAYAKFEIELLRAAKERKLATASPGGKFLGLCQAIKPKAICVTPTGDVHKCWETVNQPELRHGTIFDMAEAERSKTSRRWLSFTPFDNETCSSCKLLPMCAGACAFKTVHSDQQSGEAALPCPSWKFNFAEKMFMRAEQRGVVQKDDWIEGTSNTMRGSHLITGDRQSFQSVTQAAAKIEELVDAL